MKTYPQAITLDNVNPINDFFAWAETQPNEVSVESPSFQLSFGSLAASVKRFASKFEQLGVRKGHIVAVSTRPEFETISALALLQLGAISLTGSPAILRSYRQEIDYLVCGELEIGFKPDRQIIVDQDFISGLAAIPQRTAVEQLADSDVVRLVFSSGTTGVPKGVEFTALNLVTRTKSARTNWMPADPFMSLLGLDTVTGMQTFYWSAFNGKTYLVPTDGAGNASLISNFKVKAIKTSPAKLTEFLEAQKNNPKPLELEVVEVAGSLLTRRIGLFCQEVTGITPTYLYGSTEVGTVTKGLFDANQPAKVGSQVADVEFEVVNQQIRYRKANMPKNYWLSPDTGASGFHNGWFYPGDLGNLDANSELHLIGRVDDLVNAGGAKFNLLELDTWLKESEIFDDVASFSYVDEFDEPVIGIAFVAKLSPIPELLTKRLQEFLPNLKISALVRLDALPKNKLDKVDRKALAKLAASK